MHTYICIFSFFYIICVQVADKPTHSMQLICCADKHTSSLLAYKFHQN